MAICSYSVRYPEVNLPKTKSKAQVIKSAIDKDTLPLRDYKKINDQLFLSKITEVRQQNDILKC